MAVAKIVGALMLLYAIGVFIYNFVSFFVNLPQIGVIGSYLFNPLGMAFGAQVTSQIVHNNPLLMLASYGVTYFVGGVLALVWCLVIGWIGSILIRH
jgi:hypothetical protein